MTAGSWYRNMLLNILAIAALVYGAIVLLVYVMQPQLLYLPNLPTREIVTTPQDNGMPHQDVVLETEDGERIHAWYVPAPDARDTVLIAHGNAGNISHRIDTLRIWHRLGYNTLIFDYRGYGQSSGRPDEAGTYLDARAAWDWLTGERGIEPGSIVLFGRSLGTAVVAQLATQVGPGALVVASPFTSVPDLAAELYPWLPARYLSRYEYPVKRFVRDADCPVLVIHSREDEIIPFHHGQAIYAAAAEPKSLLELSGGHNEGFLRAGERYTRGIDDFLDE